MMETKKEYSWIKYIKKRIADNKNFLGMFVGPTGSGKSFSALSVLEMLNKEFDIDMVVFDAKSLMKLINSRKYDKKIEGNVTGFLWDEAGINLSSRQWQSITNRVINFLLQTFRHKNFVLLFTAPYMDFVDKATRKLFHAVFETAGIDKKNQTVIVKPKQLEYNADKGKFYYHYLKIIKNGKGYIKIKRWAIPRPSPEVEKEYEKKKIAFTTELNKQIEESLSTEKSLISKPKKPLTPRQQLILECWKKGIKTLKEIAKEVGKVEKKKIHIRQIYNNEKYMENKGYNKAEYIHNAQNERKLIQNAKPKI